MIEGIYISASGMLPKSSRHEAIANNLANAEVPGFKRDAMFLREMQESKKRLSGDYPDWRINRVEGVWTDFDQGPLRRTGGMFDVAIKGKGFFAVETPDGVQYTRNGTFARNNEGVLVNMMGHTVLDVNGEQIAVPNAFSQPLIDADGMIKGRDPILGIDTVLGQLQAGQDAEVTINGITLRRSTNTITDAVQGVTMTLREPTEEGTPIEISVSKDDTSQLRAQLEDFVGEYNNAMNLISEQFRFDDATETAGPLAGDSTLLGVQSRLRSAVNGSIAVEGEFNALVFMGITFDREGQLTIDDERLTDALDNNLASVKKLFVAEGSTTDNKIEFVRSNERTTAGDYDVDISTAAARAEVLGSLDLSAGIAADQTVTITEAGGDSKLAEVQLQAGDDTDDIVAKINAAFNSQVAEVRRATLANTTDGTTAITESTTFGQINGAGAVNGDTIRIQGTTHDGTAVQREFTIADVDTATVGDLLADVRAAFGNNVSANIDSEGRLLITDNQVGPSNLTLALVEKNEGDGTLDFGSVEVEDEGRFQMEITAESKDGFLMLRHDSFGERAGFTVTQSVEQLGIDTDEHIGVDVQGTINGETADGFGRILTGVRDNDKTDGLALRVTATAEEVTGTSDFGTINLVYGVGRILDDTLSFITDSFDGTLKTREDAIDDTIDNMQDQIAAMERRVEQKRLNLVGKFASLEGTLATLQSQGDFLTSQLAGLSRG